MDLPLMESLADFLQRRFPFNLIRASRELVDDADPPEITVCVKMREPEGWTCIIVVKLTGSTLSVVTPRYKNEGWSHRERDDTTRTFDVADPTFDPQHLADEISRLLTGSTRTRPKCARKKERRR